MTSPEYKKRTVDKLSIIKTFEPFYYNQLLNEYKLANGKDKKPVNPRGKNPVIPDTVFPRYGDQHNYIYDNAGVRGQLCFKVCDFILVKTKLTSRPHSYADFEPLNSIPDLERISTMPGKRQKLIEPLQQLILKNQVV